MVDQNQGKILVVEDEKELRFVLKAHLHAIGFCVIECSDGHEAIRIAQQEPLDLIIMDIGIPGIDGLTVTKTLKADPSTANIPIIMLTARTGKQDIIRGLEAGAQEYLSKPFDIAELLTRVQTVYKLANARKDLDKLNSELEAEVDAKTIRLQLLYEYMRDLNHAKSRDDILDLLMKCIQGTCDAQRISLFLADASGENLVCVRAIGIDPATLDTIPIKSEKGITGKVYSDGQGLLARTIGNSSELQNRQYATDMFFSTPLLSTAPHSETQTMGVVNVTEKKDCLPFTDEEVDCIRSIADAAAVALDREARRTRLQYSMRVLLKTVGQLAEYRDEETTLHLERVSKMARILAESLQNSSPYQSIMTPEYLEMIVQGAPLHDIGKVGIPDEILTKPGKLTDEEFQIMKTHTEIGRKVLSQALDPKLPDPQLQICMEISHSHHERYDGNGYPKRLKGDQIPLSARIVALVDAYDAITSRRRYKEARTHADAVNIIRKDSGAHFDPILVEAFLACQERFNEVRQCLEETEYIKTPSIS